MKVVNLFGPPGTGKSTVAAMLFGLLKMHNHESEFVPEFAKVLTWAQNHVALRDQLYVFAKQDHRLEVLREQPLEFVVSDGPLLNSLIYLPANYYGAFPELVLEVFHSFENVNIVLERQHAYSPVGRSQSEEEAFNVGTRIEQVLKEQNIEIHARLNVDHDAPGRIFELLTGHAPLYAFTGPVSAAGASGMASAA